MKKRTIIIVCGLILTATLEAQFSLSGEFRPRAEYSHGYRTLAGVDQNPFFFTSQRTRLNLNYSGDKIKIQLGYSHMFAADGMLEIKGGSLDETHNWAYLMFAFTPKFFEN